MIILESLNIKYNICKHFYSFFLFLFISQVLLANTNTFASQNKFMPDRDIDSSFKEKNEPSVPVNPMDVMNLMRQITASDDATSPTDALDEAIEAYEIALEIRVKEKILIKNIKKI